MENTYLSMLLQLLICSLLVNVVLLIGVLRLRKIIKTQLGLIHRIREVKRTNKLGESVKCESESGGHLQEQTDKLISGLRAENQFQKKSLAFQDKQLALLKTRLVHLKNFQSDWQAMRDKLEKLKASFSHLEKDYLSLGKREQSTKKHLQNALAEIDALVKLATQLELDKRVTIIPEEDDIRNIEQRSLDDVPNRLDCHASANSDLMKVLETQYELMAKLNEQKLQRVPNETIDKLNEHLCAQDYVIEQLHHNMALAREKQRQVEKENDALAEQTSALLEQLKLQDQDRLQIMRLEKELENTVTSSVDMLNCIETLESECESLRNQLHLWAKERASLSDRPSDSEAIKELQQRLDDKQSECNDLLLEVAQLEEALFESRKSLH